MPDTGKLLHNEAESDRPLYRTALRLAWPAVVEGALLSIISSVDTMMVQMVDENAIASVSLTTQPRLILLLIAQALCVGTTALVARRRGEGDQAGARSVLAQSMAIVTLIGIVISLTGSLLAPQIMDLAGADDLTRGKAVTYFRIICSGMLFNCWNLCICAALRAVGNTRITLVTNLTANLINVFLNWCLIGGNLGFPRLGVAGAAIATVTGTALATMISFRVVTRRNAYLRWRPGLPRFEKRTLQGLLKVGGSSAAENVSLRLGFFMIARMVAAMGTLVLTSYTIVQQVTNLSFTVGDGLAIAGATLVGQALGAEKKDLAARYVKVLMTLSWLSSVIMMLIFFFGRRAIGTLFTRNEVILSGTSWAFLAVIASMISQSARVVYSGCLRGAGDTLYVAVIALICVTTLRPFVTWLCFYQLHPAFPNLWFNYTGPWIAFLADAVLRRILLARRVKSGKYLEVRL